MVADTRTATTKTARQLYDEHMADGSRKRIGFGVKCALVNIDFQTGYLPFAPYAHPEQIPLVNRLTAQCRARGIDVIWLQNVHNAGMDDYGIRGLRVPGKAAASGLIEGEPTGDLDPRLDVQRDRDFVIRKRMPSGFFETNLASLLISRRIDTLIFTGASTSGCLRASVVDAFSYGVRAVVVEETAAGQDESSHYGGLRDIAFKYADVLPLAEVEEHIRRLPAAT